jgi:hypothetical protein
MTSYTTTQNDARLRNSAADLFDVGLNALGRELVSLANLYDEIGEGQWRGKALMACDLIVKQALMVKDQATMTALMKAYAAIKAA